MVTSNKYSFSLTAASLRVRDMATIAKWKNAGGKPDVTSRIGHGKSETGKRLYRELRNRVNTLSAEQLELLKKGSHKTQKEITFLAACKYFSFLREFVTEVLREKFLVYDYELTDGDYLSFFRRKAEAHPEVDELTENTRRKVKQVILKMLEEAGIIDSIKTRIILPQIIEPETQKAIVQDDSEWLKIFLFADNDINRLKEANGQVE